MPLPAAATTRSPDGILCEAPLYVVLKHPSRWRSDPWRFLFGRWVLDGCWVLGGRPLGVGCWVAGRWVLGVGWPLGVGCSRAATTRSADWMLCKASLDGVLKHPSRWRRDPQGIIFQVLGVGCWMRVGCWVRGRVAPGGSSRRRGHFAGNSMSGPKAPVEGITTVSS
jgi:hypothetical protein